MRSAEDVAFYLRWVIQAEDPEDLNLGSGLRKTEVYCSFFFKKIFIYLFIYLSSAALGLCCCVWAFSSCRERGLLFVAVCGLLIAVASLVAEHGL